MPPKVLLIAVILLMGQIARAQDPLACSSAIDVDIADPFPSQIDFGDANQIFFEAGNIDASVTEPVDATLTGGVLLRRGDRSAGADRAELNAGDRSVYLEGNVRYQDSVNQIRGDTADFAYDSGRIEFTGAEFSLGSNSGRGAAGVLRISESGKVELGGVAYTTCPPGSEDWLLQARNIDIDTSEGVGTARNVRLRFKGVPLLYAPYLSFPIGDARKTGLLAPEIGSSGRSGNEIRVPFYWNIAANYDATLTSRLLTDRGFQGQIVFRYLTERHDGNVNTQLLPNDDLIGEARHLFQYQHQSLFASGWRGQVDIGDVSDPNYFEDLGGSLSASSLTHLNRSVTFDRIGDTWSFFGRIQDYQTLDEAISAFDEPYRRLPQLVANAHWPDKLFGIDAHFNSELVNFDRDVGVTGWRANLSPELRERFGGPGWFIEPAVALDHTLYELSDTAARQEETLSRTLPIASLDAGLILERTISRGANAGLLQTLEPRMLYVHVPHRNQDELPVFDTIAPDLNLVQLFQRNRLLGVDRYVDTDQLSLGVTSRILDVSTGEELVTATIGQALYLSESGVELPDQSFNTSRSSDYIAEVGFLVYDNLNFDIGHQWGTGDNGTTQSEARLQYRPGDNKVFNLAYRFRRDSLEQGDVSWSWPLSKRWNFVGRYNFSFRDDEALEQFFGLEYESCCYGLRLVSRRHISTRDGTRDSSIGLQLVLKGLSSVGSQSDKLLERGILGYSANLQ